MKNLPNTLCQHSQKTRSLYVSALVSVFFLGALSATAKSNHSKKSTSSKQDQTTKIGTLYTIGYSHLDTQWCWTYPGVIGEYIPDTMTENFAFFKKYPDYTFNWTGSNRYVFMKEYYPKLYAELKQYVKEGRWFPAGSCIEEGDVNSPSEESIIRQILYANDFFRKEFGVASTEFMLPDCFGFPASLPSIFAHSGLKGFSTQKLTWGSAVGIPFNVGEWVGPDGQSVTAALNPGDYTSSISDDLSKDAYWVNRMKEDVAKSGVGVDYHYYGTGDRGGAPSEDSVINLEKSIHSDGPLKVVAGPADTMFNILTQAQKDALPHYTGDLELTWHSCGSLSSETAMKRWNRKNEYLGDYAERSALTANWLGAQPYPQARITDAWLRFLPGQFHDLMAGTALPKAYNYTWNDEVIAMNEFADVINHSVGAVSRDMDTESRAKNSVSLLVYNPLSIERQDVVDATVKFPEGAPEYIEVLDPSGQPVPSQIDSRTQDSLHVVFLASVPSLGYSNFTVNPAEHPYVNNTGLGISDNVIGNSRYRVTLNKAGDVESIFDKQISQELLAAPARLAYQYENPTQYPAWNMDWEDQSKPPRAFVDGPATVKVVENGPARVSLEVTRESEGSIFHQTIRLAAGHADGQVVFDTSIDWQGKESALKAVFPLTASNPNVTYNLGPGTIQRDTNNPKRYEDLSHGWFDLTDTSGKWGTTILDDCKYGSDKPNDNTVRLTLIYTPGVQGGFQHQAVQDWGRNVMTYAVEGHAGNWRNGNAQWQSARLNQPLLAFQVPSHKGDAGRTISFAQVNTDQVSIEAMKKAENSNKMIVRFNELLGEPAKNVQLKFAAPITSVKEVNGQEFAIDPTGPMHLSDGSLTFDMDAYRPRAFEVTLGEPDHHLSQPKSESVQLPFNQSVESSWQHPTGADFDGKGNSIPGEMLPSKVESGGIAFQMGPNGNGDKNAVSCQGQTIDLPSGKNRKLYFLAASSNGDQSNVPFAAGGETHNLNIQDWGGFIGQWDNRLWGGIVPAVAYDWHNPLIGLEPGFIKRAPVAWYCDHHRKADGSFDIYSFCYLFRYSIPVPDGVNSITLPNQPDVKIMAASVSSDPNDVASPVQPIYDELNRSNQSGPFISPSGGDFHAATKVTITHPLYWNPSEKIHYTLDGTTPTASSPVYTGPFTLDQNADLKAAQIDENGEAHFVSEAQFTVNDTTPPTVQSVMAMAGSKEVVVQFSKPVSDAAADPHNYQLTGEGSPERITLKDDNSAAVLVFGHPLGKDSGELTVTSVTDRSPNKNALDSSPLAVAPIAPVAEVADTHSFAGEANQGFEAKSATLPVKGDSPWTINLWMYTNKIPAGSSPVAGFGSCKDDGGHQRYLCLFDGNLHFWGANVDLSTGTPAEVGQWQMVTMTYDGNKLIIYSNGQKIAEDSVKLADAESVIKLGPVNPWGYGAQFDGKVRGFSVWDQALPASFVSAIYASKK